MTITVADVRAAREAADGIPKEAAWNDNLIGDTAYWQQQADALGNQLKTMSSPAYWQQQAAAEFAASGLTGSELEAAQREFVKKKGLELTEMIGAYQDSSEAAASGGMLNRYSGAAGGIGAVLGALLGGVFGGKAGAVAGGLLGGIGMFIAQKLGLGGEALHEMLNGAVDSVAGQVGREFDSEGTKKTLTEGATKALQERQAANTAAAEKQQAIDTATQANLQRASGEVSTEMGLDPEQNVPGPTPADLPTPDAVPVPGVDTAAPIKEPAEDIMGVPPHLASAINRKLDPSATIPSLHNRLGGGTAEKELPQFTAGRDAEGNLLPGAMDDGGLGDFAVYDEPESAQDILARSTGISDTISQKGVPSTGPEGYKRGANELTDLANPTSEFSNEYGAAKNAVTTTEGLIADVQRNMRALGNSPMVRADRAKMMQRLEGLKGNLATQQAKMAEFADASTMANKGMDLAAGRGKAAVDQIEGSERSAYDRNMKAYTGGVAASKARETEIKAQEAQIDKLRSGDSGMDKVIAKKLAGKYEKQIPKPLPKPDKPMMGTGAEKAGGKLADALKSKAAKPYAPATPDKEFGL